MPDASAPQRGRWVRDQVDELRRRGVEVDLFDFPPRPRRVPAGDPAAALAAAARALRPRPRPLRPGGLGGAAGRRAAAGRHLPRHRRPPPPRRPPLAPARLAGRPRRRRLAGAVRARGRPARPARRPGLGGAPLRARPAALRAASRAPQARRALGLDPDGPFLFFPANPARPEKRHDRAAELAAACGADLLTGGSIEPGADAALDQRRQRGPRHLRLRGFRDGRDRGARLRGPGPLDRRSASPPTPSAGSTAASARPSTPPPGRRSRAATSRRPTRASPAPRGRRPSRPARDGRAGDRGLPQAVARPEQ